MKRPILIALIGYIIGIIWGLYLRISIAPLVIAVLGIYLFFTKSKMNSILMIILISILISNSVTIYLNNRYEKLYKEIISDVNIVATIISDANKREYSTTYIISVESIDGNEKYKNTKLLLRLSNNYNNQLKYGDKVIFKGIYNKAESQRNYKGFDYAEYLRTQKIYGIVTCSKNKIEILKSSNLNGIKMITNEISNKLKNNIKIIFGDDEAKFLIGILLGDNKNIDKETKEYFRNSGLYHILAVSGTHMSYIVLGITLMLDKISISKNIKSILKIISISFFILITNNSISVLRAGIMTMLAIGAQIFYRKNDNINSICFSMLIILIDNPYSIKNISFQLSYGGVIGIITLNKIYLILFKKIQIRDKLRQAISAILSAQTMIIPIIILNYNTISFSFLITNLLASGIIGVIIILGFITLFISFISIKISSFLAVIVSILIKLLIIIAKICGELPLSRVIVVTPYTITIIIYYILLVFICSGKLCICYNNIMFNLKYFRNIHINTMYRALTKKKTIIISVFIVTIILGKYNYVKEDLHIYFIDVGQGDSTLVVTPNNKKILIDGGGSESSTYDVGENTLLPYLLDRRINKIDFIMISHFDTDHCGGILSVLESIKVENVIISKQVEISNNFISMMNIARHKNVNVIVVKKGDIIKVDNDVEIRILYPEIRLKFDDLNNNSIVAKLVYNNFSMLFTGDIESRAEERVIALTKNDLQATVLKVAHHGSITSSTQEFLKYIKPKIALIGVGKNNKFGHPDKEVLKRLEDMRSKSLQYR